MLPKAAVLCSDCRSVWCQAPPEIMFSVSISHVMLADKTKLTDSYNEKGMMQDMQTQSHAVNRAYVLIDAEEDRAGEVVSNLRGKSGITLADVINGPYRAIAVVESRDISAMAKTILLDIRMLSGVKDIIVYMTQDG